VTAAQPEHPATAGRVVVPGTGLQLLLLATRRLAELLAEDTRTGRVDPPTLRAAVPALSRVSFRVYDALCAATGQAPEHAQDHLAAAAAVAAAGEHSVRLARLLPALDAVCEAVPNPPLPALRRPAGDRRVGDQAAQLAGPFCHHLRAAGATPPAALRDAPQLVGYPDAAHTATQAIAGAATAAAAPGDVVARQHAAARALDHATPPPFLTLDRRPVAPGRPQRMLPAAAGTSGLGTDLRRRAHQPATQPPGRQGRSR
jgi:hypothetical protein